MRALSLQDRAALECAAGFASVLRVRVLRGTQWVDLSTLMGGDMLMGAKWSTNLDAQVAQATLSVARNGPDGRALSLAPLVASSALNSAGPILRVGAWVLIEVATVPLGTARSSPLVTDGFREVFRGRIDQLDVGAEEINATCLDAASVIQDTFAESEKEYGSDAGTPVQVVMQAILNDWGLGSLPAQLGVGLYVPVDPLSMRGKYLQRTGPVLDALRELAGQIGWDVRYRWRADTNAWALSLWSPDRLATAPVWRYGPEHYVELSSVAQSLADIRTDVEVVYSDKADKDSTGLARRKKVYAENPTARALYGRRWMQVAEASTSNINTAPEAQRLADAAIADLSRAALQVTMRLQGVHWHLEVSDLVAVGANGVHFDTDQALGVVSIECECGSNGEARTTVQLRGAPSTSIMQWMQREAAPGCAPSAPFTGPSAPVDLVPTPTVNGFALTFKASASGATWDSYELHVSPTAGFAPSSGTFKTASRATRFEVADLTPGASYYARVVGRDRTGNLGAASAEVALAPRYVEPRMLFPRVSYAALPLNSDFEAATSGVNAPPDAWVLNSGAWGASVGFTSDAYAGSSALRFIPSAATSISSQPFVVRGGETWIVSAYAKQDTANVAAGLLVFEFLNSAFVAVSNVTVSLGGATTPANTYSRFALQSQVPATARYAIVTVSRSSTFATVLTLDSVSAVAVPTFESWRRVMPSTDTSISKFGAGFGNENESVYGLAEYRRNDLGDVEFRGNVATTAAIASGATLLANSVDYRPSRALKFYMGSSAGIIPVIVLPTGGVTVSVGLAMGVTFSLTSLRYSLN
ncbi:fibronectin type III domain-containing protein [Myxococcaceae bacterium JPH2]|nr:fibronectin type III domain-containing protein [Myxococcaceae bacterium JPH2]